ncbi:Uncharacterized protein dnm_089240 [Desulfonema magnum]|uniref:Uncharacterized protein n=1 Tax=Desulfonema magnum TaxID=45655 RepID=A0A975GT88_9BACT|nr:Uncharacterized protein dnm_089240 [Desulfonema magnum]
MKKVHAMVETELLFILFFYKNKGKSQWGGEGISGVAMTCF